VRHHLVAGAGQHALHQQLHFATAGFFAVQARLDDLRVVEHQQVAGLEQVGQFAKDAVHRRVGPAIQQARGTAFGCGVLGNQLGGQVKVEIAEGVGAWRARGRVGHAA
jgi:hypothetical protein